MKSKLIELCDDVIRIDNINQAKQIFMSWGVESGRAAKIAKACKLMYETMQWYDQRFLNGVHDCGHKLNETIKEVDKLMEEK